MKSPDSSHKIGGKNNAFSVLLSICERKAHIARGGRNEEEAIETGTYTTDAKKNSKQITMYSEIFLKSVSPMPSGNDEGGRRRIPF